MVKSTRTAVGHHSVSKSLTELSFFTYWSHFSFFFFFSCHRKKMKYFCTFLNLHFAIKTFLMEIMPIPMLVISNFPQKCRFCHPSLQVMGKRFIPQHSKAFGPNNFSYENRLFFSRLCELNQNHHHPIFFLSVIFFFFFFLPMYETCHYLIKLI